MVHFEHSTALVCLAQTLTDHEGGVSLEGIKRTLPFSLVLLSLKPQLSINKRLLETKGERGKKEKSVKGGKRQKTVLLYSNYSDSELN